MCPQPHRYISYLLRLWQVNSNGQPAWRASLEDPHTGQRRGFARLADMVAFLEKMTVESERQSSQRRKGEDDAQ